MVAELVAAAAVAAQHQVAPRVQGEGVARHARQSDVTSAVRVASCCLEEEPKRLFIARRLIRVSARGRRAGEIISRGRGRGGAPPSSNRGAWEMGPWEIGTWERG